jgi:hypothetical protein
MEDQRCGMAALSPEAIVFIASALDEPIAG